MSKLVDVVQKTPEQELEELKNKELLLKEQIKQPDSILRDTYFSKSPKKNVISKWAENLEEQYDLEVKLNLTPSVKSVGAISSHIKDELRNLGVPSSTLSYVHMVLGYKYKNDHYDRYETEENDGDNDYRRDSSNLIAVNFEKDNQQIIQTINQQIDFLKNYRIKARSSRILSALTPAEVLQYEETNLRIQATISFASQVIDDRQSVPILAQLKLVMAIVAATNNSAAAMYITQIKLYGANKMAESQQFFEKTYDAAIKFLPKKIQQQFSKTLKDVVRLRKQLYKIEEKKKTTTSKFVDVMTSKQAMKIVYGVVKKVLPVFDHHSKRGIYSRDAAILDNFYGVACPECGSYRVREKEDADHEWVCFCYDCEWTFESKTIIKCWGCHMPFFEDILQIILETSTPVLGPKGIELPAKNSKCPRCENDLILPAKMFDKPKLRGH